MIDSTTTEDLQAAYREKKLFTVEEANRMLPLVSSIVKDIVTLSTDLLERRRRLHELAQRADGMPGSSESATAHDEELRLMEQQLVEDTEQLTSYTDELTQLGVEMKNAVEGVVDFPTLMDDRVVYLCWKHGETAISHWHELDAGFAGRCTLDCTASK